MRLFDVDLLTIGAGSGGVRASRVAASLGARVLVAESGPLGGTCVNVGCVPKKLMYYAADFRSAFAEAADYGWETTASAAFNWEHFVAKRNAEVKRLNGIYEQLLTKAGVKICYGKARLVDPHTVEIDGSRIRAKHILIASGSSPHKPPIPGHELTDTSDDIFEYHDQPKRILIAGGGYIGVEFAGIFAALGSETTQVHRGALVLRGFDEALRERVGDALTHQGVDLRLNTTIEQIDREGGGFVATLSTGNTLAIDRIVCATGRRPNTRDLGLEAAGVNTSNSGAVIVNEFSQTNVAHIYAIGDCTDRVNLTPVAIAEGQAVAQTLFDGQPTAVSYDSIPTAVFSHPPVATVGLTEGRAKNRVSGIDVFESAFRPLKRTLTTNERRNYYKVIVDRRTQRILGCHLVGEEAPELIQLLAVAIKMGLTKRDLDQTIAVHPTSAEELVLMRSPRAGKPT